MSGWIDRLFNQHKLVRRLLVFWAIGLITAVVVVFMHKMGSIQTADATVIVSVVGLMSLVLGFYQWSRDKDDRDVRP